jgi:hypothetical protein
MVYVDIEYEGRKPSLDNVREAVLRGLAKDYTGTYTFVKVEPVKDRKEFHFVFEAEDEEDFINFGFNDLGSSLPDNLQPSGSGYVSKPKETVWIVTIANYDEPGEGLAVFAPVICKTEKEVADFINEDMTTSFTNEGWEVKGRKAYPPNYDPKDKENPPENIPVITEKSIKNNKEFETPSVIQLWTKWKITKWEM